MLRISFFAYPVLGGSKAIKDVSHILKIPIGSSEKVAPCQPVALEFLATPNEVQASSLASMDCSAQLYIDIVREATEIYQLRVNTSDNSQTLSASSQHDSSLGTSESYPVVGNTIARLASIRRLVEQVNPSAPGSHTIVWPAFVAAAESRSDDDREFFTAILQRIWQSTGYANVLKGLNALPGIWEQQKYGRCWTSMLPTLKTVVM